MARILITGANRGIGAALSAEAKSRGHTVIATTRTGADGDIALPLDDPSKVAAAMADLEGPIDILINNAGIIGPKQQSTLDMDWDGFAATLSINTMAPLAVAQAALPALRQADHPRIMTISSQMSAMGSTVSDRIAYRASKSAVNKVMQALATDLKEEGITVTLIDPGWVRTDMGGSAADEDPTDVAKGIMDIAESVSHEQTGLFFRFSGEVRDF